MPIYAGTDAGGFLPHGLVGRRWPRSPPSARPRTPSAPASWRARAWLGHADTLAEGVPADLVVFDADPRRDLTVLTIPAWSYCAAIS